MHEAEEHGERSGHRITRDQGQDHVAPCGPFGLQDLKDSVLYNDQLQSKVRTVNDLGQPSWAKLPLAPAVDEPRVALMPAPGVATRVYSQ